MSENEFDIGGFMLESLKPFRPFAYFDKHMDCIRVLIKDVSVVEVRQSDMFTVARPAHPTKFDDGRNVGFTIKGVAHLFKEIGLPLSGVHQLVEILDEIVKKIPHTTVKRVVDEFSGVLREQKLSVDLDVEKELLAA